MKIEKINDNQIRCTLTTQDLEHREIKLSELAYGSEKAKGLFRDMMQEANLQFGFEANNVPLMIEAIPTSSDTLVLIITKVEDPEELDTRFSKFSSSQDEPEDFPKKAKHLGADDVLELLQKLSGKEDTLNKKEKSSQSDKVKQSIEENKEKNQEDAVIPFMRMYLFPNLERVIQTAKVIGSSFNSLNTLYKESGNYFLILYKNDTSAHDFNKLCNLLSEYGEGSNISFTQEAYLKEHGEIILSDRALQNLNNL